METPGLRYLNTDLVKFLREDQKMALITGPRQVGKTTLAKRLLVESGMNELYFNWDIDAHRKLLVRNPGDFWQRGKTQAGDTKTRIVLDEIHKFPRWKRFLKGLYDEHGKNIEIIVTGSGRLDIYQRGGDSLFGRYNLFRLHPFTLGELLTPSREYILSPDVFWKTLLLHHPLKEAEEHLKKLEMFTGFPEPLFAESETRLRRWRQAHRQLVLREDIRDLTRIRDIGLVETLALLLTERVGSPLSFNSLSEDLSVNFTTVKNWIETMSRLYYLFQIKPFAGRLVRTLRQAEKIYLFDGTEIQNEGARFENLTALHLHKLVEAWTDSGFGEFDLYYVRDREKREVDFLITEQRKPYALIEAKLSARDIDPSLRYFSERLKPRYTVQVVRKPEGFTTTINTSGIILTPAKEFLALM
ncbi:MAG: ATP-binding protein [Ignavibacteriae bacterium]|nr:ATP-binding protein [Ignavibacteriota bacterium]